MIKVKVITDSTTSIFEGLVEDFFQNGEQKRIIFMQYATGMTAHIDDGVGSQDFYHSFMCIYDDSKIVKPLKIN